MKKTAKSLLALAAACAVGTGAALALQGAAPEENVMVLLNGTELEFDQPPVLQNGTTLVPMRTIFEALGTDVSWNGGERSVTAVKNGKSAYVAIDSKNAVINGAAVELAEAPIIKNGTTLVPLRVISEAMGVDVDWDGESRTVIMTDTDKVNDESWKDITGDIDLTAMTVSGPGLSVEGKTVLVTGGGDFTVTGTNADAMIRVNTDSRVKLRLKGVDLTNTDGPAIFFENCDKGFITVSKDTENRLADGAEYSVDAKGTVFSNDDLEIQGGGKLTVISNSNHAIVSDDKLTVEEGTLVLTAKGDGLHANDGIEISGGDLTVSAEGDGIQSEDYVDIIGGSINITTTGEVAPSAGDFGFGGRGGGMGGFGGRWGRQPAQDGQQPTQPTEGMQPPEGFDGQRQPGDRQPPEMQGGQQPPEMQGWQPQTVQPASGQTDESAYPSTKGIKAETNLLVRGGSITVNSADHCLHSAGIIFVNDGLLNLTSQQGKGASAHMGLSIDGGTVNVLKSTEGLESKDRFAINGGSIHVTAGDDGLNAGGTGGRDAGMSGGHCLYMNGGYVYVDAAGDGLDANGTLYLTGGTAVVNGPTNSGNGALDSGGSVIVTGGTLIASGAAGMAEYPRGEECTQPTVVYTGGNMEAGDIIRIEDSEGNEILTYSSPKSWQNIVFSSPLLEQGKEYRIYTGGSYDGGTSADGCYRGGSYQGGTEAAAFTLDSITKTLGNAGGMGGFGGFGGRGGRMR